MVFGKLTSHPESPASYIPAVGPHKLVLQMTLRLPLQHPVLPKVKEYDLAQRASQTVHKRVQEISVEII